MGSRPSELLQDQPPPPSSLLSWALGGTCKSKSSAPATPSPACPLRTFTKCAMVLNHPPLRQHPCLQAQSTMSIRKQKRMKKERRIWIWIWIYTVLGDWTNTTMITRGALVTVYTVPSWLASQFVVQKLKTNTVRRFFFNPGIPCCIPFLSYCIPQTPHPYEPNP